MCRIVTYEYPCGHSEESKSACPDAPDCKVTTETLKQEYSCRKC
jgi:hypothetical protein